VWDGLLNSALLFPNAESEITTDVYLFFLFHVGVTTVFHDDEVQTKVAGAANGF